MMKETTAWIGVDWGTSNLRAYWIHTGSWRCMGTVESNDGVWTVSRSGGDFATVLLRVAGQLRDQVDPSSTTLPPILVSGMATSSIGWLQLPYGELPWDMDSPRIPHRSIKVSDTWVTLFSGLRDEHDLMRGEETECLGLYHWLGASAPPMYRVLLPGTHSKWVSVQQGNITGFRTFLTGELYGLLRNHSILRDSLHEADSAVLEPAGFVEGVHVGAQESLLGSLFQVRARALLYNESPQYLYSWLSGLLIGHELSAVEEAEKRLPHYCLGSNLLCERYQIAAQTLGYNQWHTPTEQERVVIKTRAWLRWADLISS